MLYLMTTQRIKPQLIIPLNAVWNAISIDVTLTELEKPGCKEFHLYDGIDITKLSAQSSLKCLITEINEKKHLLA